MDPRLPLRDVAAYAQRVEAAGFDGLHVPETVHDSLAVAMLVVEHTERIVVRTAVTLAFVRSPMLVAYTAWDLSRLSGGRFELGLGTQIRQNVEDRFGMPWSEPVARLRDYVEALHAAYLAFRTGEAVRHDGDTYRLTRLQPYFNPGPDSETVPPPTWLGAVNAGMCRLAGELAFGVVTHPTNSDPAYLRDVVLPNIEKGAAAAGRSPEEVDVIASPTLATGTTDDDVSAEREHQRRLLAFLYSTPAYRPTLELRGFGDLPERLQAMIRADRWDELPQLMTDDVLDAVVTAGRYDQLPTLLADRFGSLVDGIALPPLPDAADETAMHRLVRQLQEA